MAGHFFCAPIVPASSQSNLYGWHPEGPGILAISAERGDGIDMLASAIARRVVPDPPPAGAGVPFRPAQVRRINEACQALRAGDHASAEGHLRVLLAPLPHRSDS